MFLGKVKGNIVSTQKNSYLKSHKLLLVHPTDLEGNLINKEDVIAIDFLDSGIGDTVLVAQEGDAVEQILGHANAPINSIVVAVVDDYEVTE